MQNRCVPTTRRRGRGQKAALAAAILITAVALHAPAKAGADRDYYGWRDGPAGPVFGFYVAGPYGYYYPVPSYPYPAVGFYGGPSYYDYYYGRTDFGYVDSK